MLESKRRRHQDPPDGQEMMSAAANCFFTSVADWPKKTQQREFGQMCNYVSPNGMGSSRTWEADEFHPGINDMRVSYLIPWELSRPADNATLTKQ